MEILNNIWIALSTENEMLIKIIYIPLAFAEASVYMLLFTTILNIPATKKQKCEYVLFASILGILSSVFIPKPYGNIITFILLPFAIMYIFKVNFLKGLLGEFIPVICVLVLEMFLARIFLSIYNINYEVCANIPLCHLCITLIIYTAMYTFYKIIKHYNFNIYILNTLNSKNKQILISNIIFALIVVFMQMYLIVYYSDTLPSFIVIINILSLIAYAFISLFSLIKTMKLEKTTQDLEQEKLYNKTLQILHDNVRAFKHDFSNIIAGIGGYVETNDMEGLKKYYHQLLQECGQVNNLSSLNPTSINNPAVYSVLANKYYKADNLGIKITLESFIDFDKLNMDIYEFTRILGILMDNAIEASSECDNKLINVTIRNDPNQHRQLLIIENTYKNKDVDLEKIYTKGFSTKQKNTGLGLWEVNKIISKRTNIARYTTKNDEFFRQQIEIYNK